MDLTNYMIMRTKEKMVLESNLRDQNLITQQKHLSKTKKVPQMYRESNAVVADQDLMIKDDEKMGATVDIDLLKEINLLRTDIDEAFVKLDRMLYIAKSKEQTSDFPVAFVTNLLYLISLNNL